MKFRNTKLSKRTLALLAATALLFGGGGFAGTKAALTYFSNDYTAEFKLDHLQVHLIENGVDVCHDKNKMITVHRSDDATAKPKQEKYKGNLVEYLGYKNDTHYGDTAAYKLGTPGKVEPGRTYKEEIGAKNGNDINEYVRLTVRKYWVGKDGKKQTALDPEFIKLTYNGNDYNTDGWQENIKEATPESRTFYLNKILGDSASSPLLFNELTIDKEVANLGNEDVRSETRTDENGQTVTVIEYRYDYDDYTFYIEADVQAIQTHNVNDAISALWGVSNVSAKNGVVTVKQEVQGNED